MTVSHTVVGYYINIFHYEKPQQMPSDDHVL